MWHTGALVHHHGHHRGTDRSRSGGWSRRRPGNKEIVSTPYSDYNTESKQQLTSAGHLTVHLLQHSQATPTSASEEPSTRPTTLRRAPGTVPALPLQVSASSSSSSSSTILATCASCSSRLRVSGSEEANRKRSRPMRRTPHLFRQSHTH